MQTPPEERYLTLKRASELTPYSANYLGLLVRKKKLEAQKIRGQWMTTREDVEYYLARYARRSEALNFQPSFARPRFLESAQATFWTVAAFGVALALIFATISLYSLERSNVSYAERVSAGTVGDEPTLIAPDAGSVGARLNSPRP